MNDSNGSAKTVGDIGREMLSALVHRRQSLLIDLNPSFPALRRFLLGCELSGRIYPAGSIRIETDSGDCIVQLSIPMLGVQAVYRDQSVNAMLERIENDLDTETVPWDHSWEVKKKMREKARRDIGLA